MTKTFTIFSKKTAKNNFPRLFAILKGEKEILKFKSNFTQEISSIDFSSSDTKQTSEWIKQDLTHHKSDWSDSENTGALVEHDINTGQKFNFDKVEILKHQNNYRSR